MENFIIEKKFIYSNLQGRFIMMDWEKPIMVKSADIVTRNGGDILEIGFGMAISGDRIQENNISTHTIIENNEGQYNRLLKWCEDKPNVIPIKGDWYELRDNLPKYDGIFYDADCNNYNKIGNILYKTKLKDNGIFVWFDPSGKNYFDKKFNNYKLETVLINEKYKCNYWNENYSNIPYMIYSDVDNQ